MNQSIRKVAFILLGSLALALGVGLFILPNDILTGGIAGVTVLLKPFIPGLNESMAVTVFSIGLFILGFVVLGKDFAMVTALCSFAYPVFLNMVTYFLKPVHTEPVVASIYGGLLCGIGVGLVTRQGGSTGGMDIPPLIFSKLAGIDPSVSISVFDGIIVLLGIWIYGIEAVLIGLFSIFFEGFGIDKAMTIHSGIEAKEVRVISAKYHEISKEIHDTLDRGTTILNAKGGYTGEERPMLLVVCSLNQYDTVLQIIKKHDSEAFVIVSETKDVHGEGFTFTPRI